MNEVVLKQTFYTPTNKFWSLCAVALTVIFWIFSDSLVVLEHFWSDREEYSYGYLIPMIVLYFIWQKLPLLKHEVFTGSWAGFSIFLFGLLLFFLGTLGTIINLVQYGFIITLIGGIYTVLGWRAFRIIAVPLLILFFMLPLPQFLYQGLSTQLQLISSELGVAVIRAFGISVHLQGNVIDLGQYKLQVVEACNGLRYLFPLMSFGFVCAYLFKAPIWQRSVVFFSSIPLTVLMNSFRIGVIGIMVEYWGTEMAEGFLHDFEGWIVFMACVGILFLEMWLLTRLFHRGKKLLDLFVLEDPATDTGEINQNFNISKPFMAALLLLGFSTVAVAQIDSREHRYPERMSFDAFPYKIDEWQGQRQRMKDLYLEMLQLTDYVIANFRNSRGENVNFYSAYYQSQAEGAEIHSPAACIPSDGWEIQGLDALPIENVKIGGIPLTVNRVQIQKGKFKQLVYYWFQQRGRIINNEYAVKWYILWDGITRSRTDGALIRLTTPVGEGEDWSAADERLRNFSSSLEGKLEAYIPS